jgi:hypothetical protein
MKQRTELGRCCECALEWDEARGQMLRAAGEVGGNRQAVAYRRDENVVERTGRNRNGKQFFSSLSHTFSISFVIKLCGKLLVIEDCAPFFLST